MASPSLKPNHKVKTQPPPARVEERPSASVVKRLAPEDSEPAPEEIARLAYSYWEARGSQGGSPEEDWLHAEQELRTQRQSAPI